MSKQKLYSAKTVMQMLDISTTTLWRIIKRGELTPVWAGSQRRFYEEEVENYLERKR